MKNVNGFQRLLEDISYLQSTIGVKNYELSNLFKTLDGDKNLNHLRELSAEAERKLALVEKKLQDAHVDHLDTKLECILVILPSKHSLKGILMHREYIILE